MRTLFAFASSATVLVALWLFWVVARVLPLRDPAHVPTWRTVAIALLAYGGLCLAYLVVGPRRATLRRIVLGLSLVAMALGGTAIVAVIRGADAGGHFEGYLVLMGVILAGHGATAILYTVLTAAVAKRLRGI
jgi:hypothetical protein